MANVDDLEWTTCDELLDDLIKNPKVQLPQLIKLNEKVTSIDSTDSVDKGQIVVIHAKRTIAKLEGTDSKGRPIRLPVDCPCGVTLKLPTGKEKHYDTIETLAKTDPLPKFVEVTSVEGLESVVIGDRLKVVIAEKTGGIPSFIHFRSSSGKHVKIAVDQCISFKLAVNDASEQLLSKIAEKSRELPVAAEFIKEKSTPQSHLDLGIFTITKGFTETVIIASAKKSNEEHCIVFPLNSSIQFQVNSKLKLAKNEEYRELCTNFSSVDISDILEYLTMVSPADIETRYVTKYKNILKLIESDHHSDSDDETSAQPNENKSVKKEEKENEVVLEIHQEQRELIRKAQKEKERAAKMEKERLKAERKREKKEKKEREKEERKKKKSVSSLKGEASEQYSDDFYTLPESSTPSSPTSPIPPVNNDEESNHPQWAMHLMSKVKYVRSKSLGFRPKRRPKLRKQDIVVASTENIRNQSTSESIYTGLDDDDDAFSDGLYETLPCDMAYESLDLINQAQRSLAPQQSFETNGDSGFDEVDQAKIKAWRDSMQPPPLPGNHPRQNLIPLNNNSDDIYEVAVDSSAAKNNSSHTAWQSFYDVVQHSTNEISTWGMEDVASCLEDLQLGKCKKTFADSQVDGRLLLDLDESVLKDLGLTFFEARKLRKFVYGWRPDAMRPESYPNLKGYDSKNPIDWSEKDVIDHLRIIDMTDVAEFCSNNQINGDLLKDICADDTIMNSIITSRDRKLKIVKIKNYVIDQWRPKQKGEGNYTSYTPMHKSPKLQHSPSTPTSNKHSSPLARTVSTPNAIHQIQKERKLSNNYAPSGIGKKAVGGDAPLIARMKQQLEENKNNWQSKK